MQTPVSHIPSPHCLPFLAKEAAWVMGERPESRPVGLIDDIALQRTSGNVWRGFGCHTWGTGAPLPLQRVIRPQMTIMPKLRNSGLDSHAALNLAPMI